MTTSRFRIALLLVALLAFPLVSAGSMRGADVPANATRTFISDDRDPAAGALPPFVLPEIDDVVNAKSASLANFSRIRDFYYATTQPSFRVGPNRQTLSEYRLAQLRSIHRNDSTSLWLPDSKRSNGTFVKDAHITILGVRGGAHTRLNGSGGSHTGNGRDLLFLPRNGTVLTYLDYATVTPNRTCTETNQTKTCVTYRVLDQRVNRSLRIGTQTWHGNAVTPRQFSYSGASATEPTTMQVRATITTTLAIRTQTYVRKGGGWTLSNTTGNETRILSHTVPDRARAVVTTNQNLTVRQTVVRSGDEIDRLILQFEGPRTLSSRRLWSYARFKNGDGRVRNIWGVYSQRQYATATRGYWSGAVASAPPSRSGPNTKRGDSPQPPDPRSGKPAITGPPRRSVPFPNVLELQLAARSRHPTLRWQDPPSFVARPSITERTGFSISTNPAPIDQHVNLTSVAARGYTRLVITNVDQPITTVHDIHDDQIPLTTRSVRERQANLTTTIINDTHARIHLSDAASGQPLTGRTLRLTGAAQARVTTSQNGTAIVERRELYLTVSFSGVTNVSQSVYYGPARTQIAFQPEPFNIYQLLVSLAGALVSIAAFLIFYLPIAYIRGGTNQ